MLGNILPALIHIVRKPQDRSSVGKYCYFFHGQGAHTSHKPFPTMSATPENAMCPYVFFFSDRGSTYTIQYWLFSPLESASNCFKLSLKFWTNNEYTNIINRGLSAESAVVNCQIMTQCF